MKFNIYIGYDDQRNNIFKVCEKSILKNSKNNIEIFKIGNSILNKNIWYREKNKYESTDFSISRFLVPFLSNFSGISIFMDDDFLWKCDVSDLMEFYDDSKSVMVCKHNYISKFETKWNSNKQINYARKNWSSLMIFNSKHFDCKNLNVKNVNEKSALWLHQFKWTDDKNIGQIPLNYNYLVGEYEENFNDIKALHFTNGCPIYDDSIKTRHSNEWLEIYESL